MKTNNLLKLTGAVVMALSLAPLASMAQSNPFGAYRAYDKAGVNVFEDQKDTSKTKFDGIKYKFGAGFTQQYQDLRHSNNSALLNNVGSYSPAVAGNQLKIITPGFQTAMANLYMDVLLADGVRLNITSYLSTKHHNETWVKGGFIQMDKLPFLKCPIIDEIMKYTTIKAGHFEVDYGDEHYRRSDGGTAIYNPFMEGNIMDEFATEIGGEVYVHNGSWFGMVGLTNGMIKGNIDSLTAKANPDGDYAKAPSTLVKAGFDKQLNKDVRFRLTGSYYGNQSCGSNTLFGGDRAGSNYNFVMEENSANPSSTTGAGTPLAFSGRFNPGFSKVINTFMFNTLLKVQGFELFGTAEFARGRSASENTIRSATQYAIEGVYRFGKTENFFIGTRYNTVSARLANNATGTGAGPIVYTGDVTINRFATAAGWFLTKNILMKGEYVVQNYDDFPTADYRAGGQFKGYVVEAVVGF